MEKLTPLELIFRDYLDGKYALISSGNLHCQGNLEQKCKLHLDHFNWLSLHVPIKYNVLESTLKTNLYNNLQQARKNKDITSSHADFHKMYSIVKELLDESYVKAGSIVTTNVKKFELTFKDDNLWGVYITYKDDSITKIWAISDKIF